MRLEIRDINPLPMFAGKLKTKDACSVRADGSVFLETLTLFWALIIVFDMRPISSLFIFLIF